VSIIALLFCARFVHAAFAGAITATPPPLIT
jgi:hypothetical protein